MSSVPESDTATASYEGLVNQLVQAISQRALFHRDHPRVLGAAREFARGLRARLEASGKEAFFLGLVQGRLVHDGRFLFGSTLLGRKLVTFLTRLRCGGILLRDSITEADVLVLLDLCNALQLGE